MAKKKKNLLRISNKIKFRKPSKGLSNISLKENVFKQTIPGLTPFAVQAAESGLLTFPQLEAGRIILKRKVKAARGRVVVLVKPTRIVTKRALETRMGRGKGAPHKQVALISKGQLIYAMDGSSIIKAEQAFKKMQQKISVKTSLVSVALPFFKSIKKFKFYDETVDMISEIEKSK